MAINKNVLAESGATVQAEDGNIMYATIQMRHGKEADMDKSKFVPAEMGVATDTKKAFMAFAPNDVKEMAFKEDIPEANYNDLDNKPSIGDVTLEGNKTLEELGIQPAGDYLTEIPEEYVTDEELGIELEKKLDKNQGEENAGKVLVVGEDGNVAPGETPIKVDSTLTQEGQAADAKATGDALEMLAIKQKASGESPLVVKDSSGFKMQGLKLFGKSRQAQTTGAQLLNKSASGLNRGVSWQFDGSKVTFDGTTTNVDTSSRVYAYVEMIDELEVGKTYYSKSFTDVVSTNFRVVREGVNEYPTSVTPDGTETSIMFCAMVNGSNGSEGMKVNLTAYVAVTENNDMVQWEPYTGGAPSPSPNYPQEIEIPGSSGGMDVKVMGENMCPVNSGKTNFALECYVHAGVEYTLCGARDVQTGFNIWILRTISNLNEGLQKFEFGMNMVGKDVAVQFTPNVSGYMYINSYTECNWDNIAVYIGVKEDVTYTPYTEPQPLTVSTPNGLPGIPVSSGGNYTDADGQQWVCDEIDLERGKYVQRVKKFVVTSDTYVSSMNPYATAALDVIQPFRVDEYNGQIIKSSAMMAKNFVVKQMWNTAEEAAYTVEQTIDFNILNERIGTSAESTSEEAAVAVREWLKDNPLTFLCQLITPIETDLSPEEIAAYTALHTNYPTTVVTCGSDPEPGIELGYVADPKNYIDQNFVPKSDVAQSYTSKSAVQPISAPLAAEMKEDIETLKQQVKSLQESMKEETA